MLFKKYSFFKIIIIICFTDLFTVAKYCHTLSFFMFCFSVELLVTRSSRSFSDVERIKDLGSPSDSYRDCVVRS